MKIFPRVFISGALILALAGSAQATALYTADSQLTATIVSDPNLSFSNPDQSATAQATTFPPFSDATAAAAASTSVDDELGVIDLSAQVTGSTGTTGLSSSALAEALGALTLTYNLLPDSVPLPETVQIEVQVDYESSASSSVDDGLLENASSAAGGSGTFDGTAFLTYSTSTTLGGAPGPLSASATIPLTSTSFFLNIPINTPVVLSFSVYANGEANSVPEPATLLLFGSALLGLSRARSKHA